MLAPPFLFRDGRRQSYPRTFAASDLARAVRSALASNGQEPTRLKSRLLQTSSYTRSDRTNPSPMAKSKKAVQRAASPSMAEEDPQRDDEVLSDAYEAPPSKKRGAKKRKQAEAGDEARQQASKPTKKPRGKKQKEPEREHEEEEEEEEEQEQEQEQEDEPQGEAVDIDPELVEQAFKQYRKEHKRLPHPHKLAEALECSIDDAMKLIQNKKRAQSKLTNERRAKKVNGYNKMAITAGYGDLKKPTNADPVKQPLAFYTNVSARGFDSHKPVLSMSDMLRCARSVPAQPAKTSFDETEFKLRCELIDTSLPADGARELLANADAVFKEVINRSVAVAMQRCGAQMVKPSHGIAVLKPIVDHMLFSSINAPPGLIEHGKEMGALPPDADDARQERDAKVSQANEKYHDSKLYQLVEEKKRAKAYRASAAASAAARKYCRAGN